MKKIYLLFILLFLIGSADVVSAAIQGPVMDSINYYNAAVGAASNGSYQEALTLIDISLSYQPEFHLGLITKAGILTALGEFDTALSILDEAEAIRPGDPSVLSAKASVYVHTGRYDEALEAADMALMKDPNLVEAWILKGTAHGGLGQYQQELQASQEALSREPDNPLALMNYQYAAEMVSSGQAETSEEAGGKAPLSVLSVLVAFLVSLVVVRRR